MKKHKLIAVKDTLLLSKEDQRKLVQALNEWSIDFGHEVYDSDDIQCIHWNPDESDQAGDVYSIECSDCGKSLTAKNLNNEGCFVPWCVNGQQKFILEEVFQMFCVEDYMGDKLGFVYCVVADTNKFIKIGYSTNPIKRLKSLQTSSPFKLKIEGFFVGEIEDEKRLQKKFHHLRTEIKNEWFNYNEEIINFFNEKTPEGIDDFM